MEIGFILFSGIVIIGLITIFGKFISDNAETIFGKSFITMILKRIGFIAENIDMLLLIIITITGIIVFIILNDVEIGNIPEHKELEKHKFNITESLTEGLDIFRGSGMKKQVENFEIERMFSSGKYHTNCNEIEDEKKRSKCLLYNN
tara:strand:- start:6538 stop:6978 length:441 start_codon:yes stop_codon:yes gene_type:complete